MRICPCAPLPTRSLSQRLVTPCYRRPLPVRFFTACCAPLVAPWRMGPPLEFRAWRAATLIRAGSRRPSLQAIWPWRASTSSLRGESTTGTAYSFPPHPRRLGRLRRRRQALGTESESNTKYGVTVDNSGDDFRGAPQVSGIQGRFGRGWQYVFAMKNSWGCHPVGKAANR